LAKLRENRNQTLFVKKVLAKDALDFSHEHLNELLAKKKQLAAELELANLGARPDIINAKKSFIKSLRVKIKNLSWVVTSKTAYSPDTGFVYDTYYVENELVTKARPVVALLFPKDIDLEFFAPYPVVKKLSIGKKIEYSLMEDEKNLKSATVIYISSEAEYVPPLVYSKDNTDKIVFKIKAKPASDENLAPGLPITIKFDA
jgi:HlyD family secretion protein